MNLNKSFLAISLSLLVGCGSSGSDTDPAATTGGTGGTDGTTVETGTISMQDGTGIYWGSLTNAGGGITPVDATKGLDTLVLQFDPSDNNMMYVVIDTTDGSAQFYEAGSAGTPEVFAATGAGSVDISETTDNVITGTLSFGNEVVGDLNISFDTKTDENAISPTVSGIADIYGHTIDNTYVSVVIDTDGTITGSSTEGCVFNGTATQIESTENMFGVILNIANCSDDGDYVGFTYVSYEDTNLGSRSLSFAIVDDNNGFYFPLDNL